MMEDQQRIDKLEKRVERLEQQQTEPIKITHIEIDTGNVRERFDRIEQKQADHSERFDTLERGQQELKQILQQNYEAILEGMAKTIRDETIDIKAALFDIKTTQGTYNERFDRIETTMATKEDLKATATKEDITIVKNDIAALKITQDEQGQKLDLILLLLQTKGE